MTYNLANFRFTLFSDTVQKAEDILVDTRINALTGSDLIAGSADAEGTGITIESSGSLDTNFGNDEILGSSSGNGPGKPGTGISNAGTIQMGFGDDSLRGIVTGESGGGGTASFNKGIYNQANGRIDMGYGNDVIFGDSGANGYGIFNEADASILTGLGKDTITGKNERGFGIYNDGLIDTGFDDDAVIGLGLPGSFASFTGNGLTRLGFGNDRVEGFGSGQFDGGFGNDKLLFRDPGTYTVSDTATDGYFSITATAPSGAVSSSTMFVKDFEWLGNVDGGDLIAFKPGATITI